MTVGSHQKNISVQICGIGDMQIIINNTMLNYRPLRDVLNAMSNSKPDGTATINVASKSNLVEFFKENGLVVEYIE